MAVSIFEVYTGKKGTTTEHGLRAKVVISLTEDIQNTYRHVYFDNFFSGVDFLLTLYRAGLYLVIQVVLVECSL